MFVSRSYRTSNDFHIPVVKHSQTLRCHNARLEKTDEAPYSEAPVIFAPILSSDAAGRSHPAGAVLDGSSPAFTALLAARVVHQKASTDGEKRPSMAFLTSFGAMVWLQAPSCWRTEPTSNRRARGMRTWTPLIPRS